MLNSPSLIKAVSKLCKLRTFLVLECTLDQNKLKAESEISTAPQVRWLHQIPVCYYRGWHEQRLGHCLINKMLDTRIGRTMYP